MWVLGIKLRTSGRAIVLLTTKPFFQASSVIFSGKLGLGFYFFIIFFYFFWGGGSDFKQISFILILAKVSTDMSE